MKMPNAMTVAQSAILAMAEIKAATEAFDRGEANVFDALDAVAAAVEARVRPESFQREARSR
jgi:hypothetical protein